MNTYKLTIVVGGREQAITIQADGCNSENGTHEFYMGLQTVAWVPSEIIVEIEVI